MLLWDGLIRGYFRLARSDQRSRPDGTSTWDQVSVRAEVYKILLLKLRSQLNYLDILY